MAIDPKAQALLSRPNFAHLSTLMPDGSPNTTPVWVGVLGDNLVIVSGESSPKVRNLRRDPRLSLSVIGFHDPYEEAQIRGGVVEFRDYRTSRSWTRSRTSTSGSSFPFATRRDLWR
jgi:PPOX class probable F420-dependent enzyme